MITEELKIPTSGRDIEAFALYGEPKPERAFLILPGKGYTINHFLLDFLWRMAAECGYYALKAEYRGYTYRHLGEPYDHQHAAEDAGFVVDYLTDLGYPPEKTVVCAKSLGTIAFGSLAAKSSHVFNKALLLTPVLYLKRDAGIFPGWADFSQKVQASYLVFGSIDPYCDLDTARSAFPEAKIECCRGADHGLVLEGDYAGTIEMNRELIEKARAFIQS